MCFRIFVKLKGLHQARDGSESTSILGLTQTIDSNPFVGHFFAPQGEKMTYRRRKVPCCRRLKAPSRKSYNAKLGRVGGLRKVSRALQRDGGAGVATSSQPDRPSG